MLQPGQIVKNYKVIDKLRKRGIGTDYKAEDLNSHKYVTIKEINQIYCTDIDFIIRLENQALLQANINHPNILQTHSFFTEENVSYFVTEYVRSETLRQRITRVGPFPSPKCITLFNQVLDAVAFAHERDVVHGDLKPANILIDEQDQIKIFDFGFTEITLKSDIVKQVAKSAVTSYLSPEQILESFEADTQTDIYALGITFFEMATAKLPFSADNENDLIKKITSSRCPGVKNFYPSHPDRFDSAILIATDKNREKRFKSCGEFSDYLNGLSAPISEQLPNFEIEPPEFTFSIDEIEKANPENNSKKEDVEVPILEELTEIVREEVNVESLPVFDGTKIKEAKKKKEKKVKSSNKFKFKYIGIGVVMLILAIAIFLFVRGLDKVRNDKLGTNAFEESSQSENYAEDEEVTTKGAISVGSPVTLIDHLDKIHSVKFNSKSTLFASASEDNSIKLWKVNGSNKNDVTFVTNYLSHGSSVNSISFSADGKYLASGSNDNTIKIWSITDNTLLKTLRGHDKAVNSVAFSPDSKYVISGSSDKTIRLWSVADGNEVKVYNGHTDAVWSVAFSPSGKTIASAGGSLDKTIKLWSTGTGQLLQELNGHDATISSVTFSPGGKYLASSSYDKTVKIWTSKKSGSFTLHSTLQEPNDACWCLTFSPDGRILAVGTALYDNTLKLYSVSSGELITTLSGYGAGVSAVAFSPDNKLLTTGSWDNVIRIYNVN